MGPIFECHLRVHTCDTDSSGRLKVSSVFNHIQNVAAIHAERLGAGIEEMLRQGMFWVLSWARSEFARFPMFGDEFSARLGPNAGTSFSQSGIFSSWTRRAIFFAGLTTAWLLVDMVTKKAKSATCLSDGIPYREGEHALCCYPERMDSQPDCTTLFTRRIRYSDLDVNRHVNNARYTEFLMDCYGEKHHRKQQISSVTISLSPRPDMAMSSIFAWLMLRTTAPVTLSKFVRSQPTNLSSRLCSSGNLRRKEGETNDGRDLR